MREFLKSLELEKGVIDSIMAEHGKIITEEKEKNQTSIAKVTELEDKIKTYETKIEELNSKANDNTKIQEELDALKSKIAEDKKVAEEQEQDKILTSNILEAIRGKEFVNERTKNSIINEVKIALQDKANQGKSAKDIFESITKDTTDVFKSSNQISNDMPDVKNIDAEDVKTANEGFKLNPMFRNFN